MEHQYRTMPSERPHPGMITVVQNVRSLATRQREHKSEHSGNSEQPTAKRCISVLAGEGDSSQGTSSITSTIQGQNSTPSSLLNNSRVAVITQHVTSTLSTTQQWSVYTPTDTPGVSSRSTPAPTGISWIDSTSRVVSSPESVIASTPTPLSGVENRPTPIPNPEARAIITNPLQTRDPETNQRQRLWQLQP